LTHSACDHILHSIHCIHFSFGRLLLKVSKQTRQKQSSSSDLFSLPLAAFVVFFPFPFLFVDINFFLPFPVSGCQILFLALFLCWYSSSIAFFSGVSVNIAVLRFLRPLFVIVLGPACGKGLRSLGVKLNG
jgi:uncharacterized membrane protein